MPVFYLVHLNYDYEESMKPFSSTSQALRYIRDTFEVDAPITDPAFARAVDDSYAHPPRPGPARRSRALQPCADGLRSGHAQQAGASARRRLRQKDR